MGLIPEDTIQEIIRANDIVQVVEQYLPLEHKSSANFFGLCPFHKEDTASFSVSPSKQIFYCFGCHKGGNVVKFIQEIEGLSFPEALRFLARRAGIEIREEESPEVKREAAKKKRLESCMLEAARYFYHTFEGPEGMEARRYMLEKRHISAATLKKFGIGASGKSWDGLVRHLRSKGYADEDILASGLARRSSKNNGLYDLFRERVIFPVFDSFGKLIAFGGRIMDQSEPKYINSPETLLYHKGRQLYALNFARKERSEELILTEGYMDAIALHEAGFSQTVASLGTALTQQQARLISRFVHKVIISYDADEAGQRAAMRGLEILQHAGLEVFVLLIPGAKDPDEYIHEFGPERFAALLDRALPLLDYKIYRAKLRASKGEGGPLDLLSFQEELADILAAEENAVLRELYSAKMARDIGVSPSSLQQEIERRRRGTRGKKENSERSLPSEPDKNPELHLKQEEMALIAGIMENPALTDQLQVSENDFSAPARPLIRAFLELNKKRPLHPAEFLALAESRGENEFVARDFLPFLSKIRREELRKSEDYAKAALKALRFNRCEEKREILLKRFEDSVDESEKQELLEKVHEINQRMLELRSQ